MVKIVTVLLTEGRRGPSRFSAGGRPYSLGCLVPRPWGVCMSAARWENQSAGPSPLLRGLLYLGREVFCAKGFIPEAVGVGEHRAPPAFLGGCLGMSGGHVGPLRSGSSGSGLLSVVQGIPAPPCLNSKHRGICLDLSPAIVRSAWTPTPQAARRVPQHVQHRPVADQAEPVGRGSGEGGIGEHQEIPHLVLGHHRDGFLVQAGRLDQMQGVGADIIAFNQPVEEAVEAAVLTVDVTPGELAGICGFPLPEPPGAGLEIGQVLFNVGRGDVLDRRPRVLLREESGQGHGPLQAVQVGFGVPAGGLEADDETPARLAKTEVRNLLDDHSLVGT